MSDLVETPKTGFLALRLKLYMCTVDISTVSQNNIYIDNSKHKLQRAFKQSHVEEWNQNGSYTVYN